MVGIVCLEVIVEGEMENGYLVICKVPALPDPVGKAPAGG